ncbi:hypothetical protein Ae168Ps1_6143 [Pseudonocardia sp. Ae168_Ps1]|uniref:hypothetical protein n=1 Tax=unclassified Pseudonocardia TaxID=2619320 RepID=UPI000958F0AA|nr:MULTISPECIES: hypothetical protein [unclassified Pseudonocardia]OLL70274.1 hypothetical protein Ae150APs1_6077 [Pseudonocardia sp. Ae150A_Ps1]OLL70546.1 hypothetical protein Ae263Ps1_6296 [Pseudonocardia sp. Ae263_Ps1]OLL70678.1 hypothetical protein Ae168Ps1_6143 [Pseudonocardia sp. Ae168_Ps1]OLL89225.1 hypothetical protein Ae356Ps1_6144c [Pseudonocardia sp. Ae356_Ps1]
MSVDTADGSAGATTAVLIFGRGAMTRLADGRKTATVIGDDHEPSVDDELTAILPRGTARLPLQVKQCHRVPELSMLPQVAAAAGLELSAFTKCRTWSAYLTGLTQQEFPGPVCVLGVAATGDLEGELPPKAGPHRNASANPRHHRNRNPTRTHRRR